MADYGYVRSLGKITRLTRTTSFAPANANAKLSLEDVGAIAANIASMQINPVLSALGVSLPITQATSPSGWAVLEEINAYGAACQVDRICFTEKGPNAAQTDPWTCRIFDNQLKALEEGRLSLIDVDSGPAVTDTDYVGFFADQDDFTFSMDDEF